MNAKKIKAIRKTAKMFGLYDPSKPTEYNYIEYKRMASFLGPDGTPQMVPVTRKQAINISKHGLKRLKKAYLEGKVELHNLKYLHELAQKGQKIEA